MSIIRQRWKNLIMSGVIGFFVALIVMMGVYVFLIRGNTEAISLLLADSNYKIATVEQKEEVEKVKVYTVIEGGVKDGIISQEMLQAIEVEERIVPENAVLNMDDLIDKKLLIDITPKTILLESMVRNQEVYDIPHEVVEIIDVRIPAILKIGDTVNLRIHYPTGQDYAVTENKEVLHINEEDSTFFVALTNEEILSYSSAREDKNLYAGTKLYITKEQVEETAIEDESELLNLEQYSIYPLNPNAQQLSLIHQFDEKVLEARMELDNSLVDFFDQEGFLYHYELKEPELVMENEEASTDNTGEELDDGSSDVGDSGLDGSDEGLVVNEAKPSDESITLNEVALDSTEDARQTTLVNSGENNANVALENNETERDKTANSDTENENKDKDSEEEDFDF